MDFGQKSSTLPLPPEWGGPNCDVHNSAKNAYNEKLKAVWITEDVVHCMHWKNQKQIYMASSPLLQAIISFALTQVENIHLNREMYTASPDCEHGIKDEWLPLHTV